MRQYNSVNKPKTGDLTMGMLVREDLTTEDHEQSIMYDLQSGMSSEIFRSLMDGRAFFVQISKIQDEDYDENSIIYYLHARILIAELDDAEIGEYVSMDNRLILEDSDEVKVDGAIFKLDEIGWKRIE